MKNRITILYEVNYNGRLIIVGAYNKDQIVRYYCPEFNSLEKMAWRKKCINKISEKKPIEIDLTI